MYLLVLLTFSSFCFSVSVEVLYEKCIFSRFFSGIYVVSRRREGSEEVHQRRKSRHGLLVGLFPRGQEELRAGVHPVCTLSGQVECRLQFRTVSIKKFTCGNSDKVSFYFG